MPLRGLACGLQRRPLRCWSDAGVRGACARRGGRPVTACRRYIVCAAEDPDQLADVDTSAWRSVRARLVARTTDSVGYSESLQDGCWAHKLSSPEKGCLLIAHPLMFAKSQSYFSQAVIFIFEHDQAGTAGLILNRPTEYVMGKVAGAEMFCPEFTRNVLYLGGDVGKGSIHLVHKHACDGAIEVVPGVHLAGFEALKAAVQEQRVQAGDVKIFTRYSGWARGQLQHEVEAGVWFVAAGGPGLILNDPGHEGPDYWHWVLELMGGEYRGLSQAVKETHREDIMGNKPPDDTGDASP